MREGIRVREISPEEGSTWSLTKLAEFLVAEGVVDDISHEGLRALLREEGVSFQDLTVYGCQEPSEDSPRGWPQHRSYIRTGAGHSDDLDSPARRGSRATAEVALPASTRAGFAP